MIVAAMVWLNEHLFHGLDVDWLLDIDWLVVDDMFDLVDSLDWIAGLGFVRHGEDKNGHTEDDGNDLS